MTAINKGTPTRSLSHALAAAICGLSVAACSDGYPTEDLVRISPSQMAKAQLLSELNALGQSPSLNKRWRYVLHDPCELEVIARNGDTDRGRVMLEGSSVDARSADGVTAIVLIPQVGGDSKAVTVLETRRWVDMVKARSLLVHLEVHCSVPVAAGP